MAGLVGGPLMLVAGAVCAALAVVSGWGLGACLAVGLLVGGYHVTERARPRTRRGTWAR